jgi:hypothetical protein
MKNTFILRCSQLIVPERKLYEGVESLEELRGGWAVHVDSKAFFQRNPSVLRQKCDFQKIDLG